MLVPNTDTRARCTGDDESAPKTLLRPGTRPVDAAQLAVEDTSTDVTSTTTDTRADRQEPLPMFRCSGLPGFPDQLIITYFRLAGFTLIT